MTDNRQTDNIEDELLSAYVDGELTDQQLALIEQRLTADPRAAQLVEELRAISRELQALPTEVVGEDLRATIRQRAERAMLLGTAAQTAVAEREQGAQRGWVWAALALAATLLLAAYLPTAQQAEQPLASAKPTDGKNRAAPRMEAVGAAEANQAGGMIAAETKPPSAPAAAAAIAAAAADQDAKGERRFAPIRQQPTLGKATTEQFDPMPLACLVHVTLSDKDAAGAQFTRRLVENGITYREGKNRQAGSPAVAAETEAFAAGKRSTAEQRPATGVSELQQLVLVEAPAERIEALLEDLHADTFNCAAVRVTEQRPGLLPIDQLRQWERSGRPLAPSHPRAGQLPAPKRRALAAQQTGPGWATRLDASQYQAGKLNVDQALLDQHSGFSAVAPQPPIQVLFILQQANGEPAAAGGKPRSGR